MSIRSAAREIESYVEMNLETLSFELPVEEIGGTCDNLSENYRILACCALLLSADTDAFLHQLHRSGQVRLYFLRRCSAQPSYHDPYSATGNAAGFWDAVASRSLELASRIVALSSERWREGEEYQDDFCFAYFCHLAIQNRLEAKPRMDATVRELEVAVEGEQSARLDICKALLALNQEQFDQGFESLLEERRVEIDEERSQFFPDDRILFRTKSRIFVEGIAILNIAELLGLQTAREYRYCPVTARLPLVSPFPASLDRLSE
jgi:hypothetical protein